MSADGVLLKLDDDASVLMSVQGAGGISNVGSGTPMDFEDVVAVIGPIGRAIRAQLDGLGVTKATVAFGLSLTVKSGRLLSLITEGAGSGSLTVTMEFDRTKTAVP